MNTFHQYLITSMNLGASTKKKQDKIHAAATEFLNCLRRMSKVDGCSCSSSFCMLAQPNCRKMFTSTYTCRVAYPGRPVQD